MVGLSEGQIKHKIESELYGLTIMSQNAELRSLAERVAEGVAKAIEANNERIEQQLLSANIKIS